MTTDRPSIRAVVNQVRPILKHDFTIRVSYHGSHDDGWFDGWNIILPDGTTLQFTDKKPNEIEAIIDGAMRAIEEELYPLLSSRFPGWEIGDGHVNGSHGYFDICSATGTISQSHVVDYNDEDDISPDEKVHF